MLASDVLDEAASLLSDTAKAQWTNTVLLPYLKMAHAELELELFSVGARKVKEVTAILSVPSGTTSFSTATILPSDFIQPIKLEECLPGSNNWRDVVPTTIDDLVSPALDYIAFYCFRNQDIRINPPSIARSARLVYRASLSSITATSSPIATFQSRLFLSHRTASNASAFNGTNVERGSALGTLADNYLNKLISIELRNQQSLSYRRRKFGSSRRLQ